MEGGFVELDMACACAYVRCEQVTELQLVCATGVCVYSVLPLGAEELQGGRCRLQARVIFCRPVLAGSIPAIWQTMQLLWSGKTHHQRCTSRRLAQAVS